MGTHYLPYKERKLDAQYHRLLQRILRSGEAVYPQQEEAALQIVGPQLRFDLANGFPIITERDLVTAGTSGGSVFAGAIGELAAFLNGEHTQEGLERYGVRWWKRWVTKEKCAKRGLPPGDLGPGSYGCAWRAFPTREGKLFDQITNVVEQIRELPHLRTHFVSPWIPQYIYRGKGKVQKVVVVPCHGWFHVFVHPDSGFMDMHHIQRSGDVPVGVAANIIQYAALLLMLAQVTRYCARTLYYTISDAHIYNIQTEAVQRLLATTPQCLPTVAIDQSVTDIFAFRQSHFTVSDYHPQNPPMRIPTAV